MMLPNRLKKGDMVGIIAPASPPNLEKLERAITFLYGLGLNVKIGKNLEKEYGYLAGQDEERLADLHEMFADDEVKAVFCACGGYGTARLADAIDYDVIRNNPKIFWGYSDITFLHTAIRQQTGLVTFHGPMLASDVGQEDVHELTMKTFSQLFEPTAITYSEQISPLHILIEGDVTGILVGGNLSLLTNTLGTKFEVDTEDKILFIEDVNEEPRSVDRMLNQMWMAGKLQNLKGVLVGDFKNCTPQREKTLLLEEVFDHYIKKINKPTMKGFNIGHCSPNIAVPLGVNVRLNTFDKKVVFENGVQ